MRWQVHGNDVATGQQVTLALDETDATHAVQSALSRRILVTHVTREGMRRALFPIAWAAVVVLLLVCAGLFWEFRALRRALRKETASAAQVAAAAADQQTTIDRLRHEANASVSHTLLAQARAELAHTRKELQAVRGQAAIGAAAARQLVLAQKTVDDLQEKTTQLHEAIRQQSEQTAAEQAVAQQFAARVNSLQQENQKLQARVDLLKSQLLIAAARPDPAPATQPLADAEETDVPRTTRWALRAGYDVAEKFVALHFEKESMHTRLLPDHTVAWSALSPANAATIRVIHDREKRRVYAATLTVSLAPDAPRQKVQENLHLVSAFIHALAPSMARIDDRVLRTLRDLADRNGDDRRVLLGGDAQITAWNNGNGLYSWRIESIGNELGE